MFFRNMIFSDEKKFNLNDSDVEFLFPRFEEKRSTFDK